MHGKLLTTRGSSTRRPGLYTTSIRDRRHKLYIAMDKVRNDLGYFESGSHLASLPISDTVIHKPADHTLDPQPSAGIRPDAINGVW